MAASRTLVNVVYSVQRAQHGEQPVFAALTLAAFLGQIGLPGGGFSHGFGSMGDYGVGYVPVRDAVLPAGSEPDLDVHPVRADQRHAAAPRRGVPVRRRHPPLPGDPPGLLGRRQPVSPPPEPQAPAARVRPAGHVHRQRDALDRHRQARRHRLSGRLGARARRLRGRQRRRAAADLTQGGRALRRRAAGVHRARRARRAARRRLQRGPGSGWLDAQALRGVAGAAEHAGGAAV